MSLNPITALSEQLEKLINEHGSAAILRDHLALFKDHVVIYEKKSFELMAKIAALESNIEQLAKDNEELRIKIQKYEHHSHVTLLDEIKIKILLLLSKQQDILPDEQIAEIVNINPQIVKFHLQELGISSMVGYASYVGSPRGWYLAQEGRRYLIEHKLIS